MIVYFADRTMSVLGHATTNLPEGYVIKEDLKTEDVNTGVASFSCTIGFTAENRTELEVMTNAGNYLLRSNDGENEFYTIIDSEVDTLRQEIYIYAEDAGLDLINEIADEFEASEAHAAEWYIDKYIIDSGFEIGINEIPNSSELTLKWEGQSTVTERLASIATQFGGYEINFSFDIKGLEITNKYVNIYKQRGQDNGVQLRLNKEVDKIITTRSVANLATAFICKGGVPDDSDEPITLQGYEYDDGDFYVDTNGKLKSRNAVAKWSRYVWNKEPNKLDGYEGHIVRPYSYNTTSKSELCSRAITELKKYCDMEVNFEANIKELPAGVKIGDRVNIIDDAGGLYLSTRLLKLETSITEQKYTATLGEHLIKGSGISQKVSDLAAQFSAYAFSAERALKIANEAKESTNQALENATTALATANNAWSYADDAGWLASEATRQAGSALEKSTAAEENVSRISDEVDDLGIYIRNIGDTAQEAYEESYKAINAADAAFLSADAAYVKAAEAEGKAIEADTAAKAAGGRAERAIATAGTAQEVADESKGIANAAKAESAQALEDVAELGTQLETLSNTMKADYVSNGDFSSVTSDLETRVSQNAHDINFSAIQTLVIDETANNAKERADLAQELANQAQAEADKASAEAENAQKAAKETAAAAAAAQSEADKAKLAAQSAKESADQADANLTKAKDDLEAVKGRIDATEGEIATAQEAVTKAQSEADTAKEEANRAAQEAAAAQLKADAAISNATTAKATADAAADKADTAQATADAAKGDASEAQGTANNAVNVAAQAQSLADAAVSTADAAQAKADAAADNAADAQKIADDAAKKAAAAQTDLDAAKANLEAVKGQVDATEDEIAEAQRLVDEAQRRADQAELDAKEAQASADIAKDYALTAQKSADEAKIVADLAQKEAADAKKAADEAQAAADALAVRVITAETKIEETALAITLSATKAEIEERLDGFYSKEQSDALFRVTADEITSNVAGNYATILDMNENTKEIVAAAATAQSDANKAAEVAAIAQRAAEDADKIAADAKNDLQIAKDNLAAVQGRVDATDGEIAEAQRLVDVAQKVADDADRKAVEAQDLADRAQQSANEAKERADFAQADADALATRVAFSETEISQTKEAITLTATKQELQIVNDRFDNYYLSSTVDSMLQVKADEITSSISSEYASSIWVRQVSDQANDAYNLADSAYSGAEQANLAADEAKGKANTAQKTATEAKETANEAYLGLISAESKIKQTQDSITSLVSKTETIESTLGDFYMKKDIDSKFEQTAESIESNVASKYATIEKLDKDKEELVEAAAAAQVEAALANGEAAFAKLTAQAADEKAIEAQKELTEAEKKLADVTGRADATEEDIAEAQKLVDAAKYAADRAYEDAVEAWEKADNAKKAADEAKTHANELQEIADDLADRMVLAETWIEQTDTRIALLAELSDVRKVESKFGDYYLATEIDSMFQVQANEIKSHVGGTYATLTETEADKEVLAAAAANAQAVASAANEKAVQAKDGLDTAKQNLENAQADLATAKQNLEDVTGRVESSEEEITAAKAAVEAAQAKADAAKDVADAAQAESDAAHLLAETAKNAADNALAEAGDLEVRVSKTETDIIQTKESITSFATKDEVTQSLSGYYTKTEFDSQIQQKADSITQSVNSINSTIEGITADQAEIVAAAALAQATAALANGEAAAAKAEAKAADEKLVEAQKDLEEAKENLTEVKGRVGVTEGDIAEAQRLVDEAQSRADQAKLDAEEAHILADRAQESANEAKERADFAQADADALANRMTVSETWIQETSEQITLFATKSEVTAVDDRFVNYYTTGQTEAKIQEKANEITSSVSSTYASSDWVRNVSDQANDAYNTANSANVAAENAQIKADEATGKANTAQKAADAADDKAAAAQKTANSANTAAGKAQDDVDALTDRVGTAETNIQQLDRSIALKASMTDVEDHLSQNYYTKTYLDSQFSIEANQIMSSVKESYTSKEEFDNLEIGGANLLANSGYEAYSGQPEELIGAIIKYGDLMPAFDKYGLGVYTLSFDIKAAVEGEEKATVVVYCGEGATTSKHTFPQRTITNITGEYVRHSFTFSPEIDNADGTNSMLKFQSGAGIYVKDVKLEKGTKPTTWTPASEDVYEKIGDVSDSVDDIGNKVTLAESAIQQLKDAISMLVIDSNGTSLLEQTSEGWTFNLSSTQDQVSDIAAGLDKLNKTAGNTQTAVDILKDMLDGENGIANTVSRIKVGEYVYTDDKGVTIKEPSLDFFASDSGFRLKITNTKILFTDGSDNLVEINSRDKSLDIEKARIKNELQMGGFVWQARRNGNLGLVWKGANN